MAAEAHDLPFAEAIDFVRGKVNLPTQAWDDLRHGAHVRAFSVAGVTRDDMLTDFRIAIEKARAAGGSYDAFRKDFDAIVDRTGWKFNARGNSEEARRAWRAGIIYGTNMRTSYMAGRYRQMTDPDVLKYRPYWRYRHSGALHPRKLHLSWDGKVWRADDPVWNVIYPPNGWGCGCDVEALSKRQLAALGKAGPDEAPDLGEYQQQDPRTGQMETRYLGIDRGWEYNVGKEWAEGIVPPELRQPLDAYAAPAPGERYRAPAPSANLPPLPAPTPAAPADLLPPDLSPEEYVAAFLAEFGLQPGEAKDLRDASGGIVTVSERLFGARDNQGKLLALKSDKNDRGPVLKLVARALQDPDEVWANWDDIGNGPVLRRSYLKQFLVGKAQRLFVRFEWSSKGWRAVTGYGGNSAGQLERARTGALLFRKK